MAAFRKEQQQKIDLMTKQQVFMEERKRELEASGRDLLQDGIPQAVKK